MAAPPCRDRALLLLLYNSGGRVQEVADLRVEHLDLGEQSRLRRTGKGDKRRVARRGTRPPDS